MQISKDKQDLSTKYTVIKLIDPDHINKLQKYLQQYQADKKTSFCRFYLRGLCIMKSQHCKFAHDFHQIDLQSQDYVKISIFDWTLGQKQFRKKIFLQKTDFHQRPLFFIKNLDYLYLYQYQFSQRYKKSGNEPLSVAEINKNESIRNRIREIMHREQWDKFISYVEKVCPDVDYTISMFSTWFGKLGFQKSQTFCKFGDFMRYLTYVKGYSQVNIVVPPLTSRSVYFVKHNTYMLENLKGIKQDSEFHKNIVRKQKQDRLKKLPEDLHKRFVCRFYMSGNCEKQRNQCSYVHNIEDLRYDPNIQFLHQYRQPPKSKEDRLNYISLYRYYTAHKTPKDQNITLEDINSKFGLKDKIRKRVHQQLYADFLSKIQEIYKENHLRLVLVKKQYTRFGFNHTDENKFGQLQGCLWQLGYHQQEYMDRNRQKHQYVSKIPPIQVMDKQYQQKILSLLQQEIDLNNESQQNQQILQSSIRRLIYSKTNKDRLQIPLHVYLRKKGLPLKQILLNYFPKYSKFIFFQSSEENFKKLIDLLKKYFKKHKKFIYRMQQIDNFIRLLTKQQINMNNFVNFKGLVQLALLQLGKELYFWPVGSNSIVIDRSHASKNIQFIQKKIEKTQQLLLKLQAFHQLVAQWVIVVDNYQKFQFCKLILSNCNIFGVDLQGKLSQGGYIDFIQISCSLFNKKHIFIIDIYHFQGWHNDVFSQVQKFIKLIFEDENSLKIMHACQQDSIALNGCLGIRLNNVFDTSGVEIYLEQYSNYKEMHKFNHTFEHTLKKIHCTKTPGLNQILQKWGAPKGINQFKQSMKKVFTQAPRTYFTTRPIIQQFLRYSARDVEDLIEVWQNMLKSQPDGVWRIIGQIYTSSI